MCLLLHSNKVAQDISVSQPARPISAWKQDGRKTQSNLRYHSCLHAAETSYCNGEYIPKHTAQEFKGHLFPAWTSFEIQGIAQCFLIDQKGKKTTKPMSAVSIPRCTGSRWYQKRKKKDSFCQSSCKKSVASVFNRKTWRSFSARCQLQLKERYGQIWHHLPQPKIKMKVVLVSGTSHSPGNRWFYVHAFPKNPKITFFHGAEIPAVFTLFLSAMLQSNVPALCNEVIRQCNL